MVVAAGAIRFPFLKFVIADGIAALVSGGLFIGLGYFLGRRLNSIHDVRKAIKPVENWVFVGLAVAAVVAVAYFWWRAKRRTTVTDVVVEKLEPKPADPAEQKQTGAV